MKLTHRTAALGLSAVLLLSTGALAADPPLSPDAKLQDLNFFCDTLEAEHPGLYAVTPKAEFTAQRTALESRLEGLTDLEFSLELQRLVAMAGDSHTTTSLGGETDMAMLPFSVTRYEEDWILTTTDAANADALGKTVTALNGLPMDQVTERFASFVSADNPVKLRRQMRQVLYVEDILVFLDLAEPGGGVTLSLSDGDKSAGDVHFAPLSSAEFQNVETVRLSQKLTAQPATAYEKKHYFSLPLDEQTYYIQYNRCQQDPELPMEAFAAQVEKDLNAGAYTQVLVDLRNNGGGSDGVIQPLLGVLAPRVWEGKIQLCGLVGETTFSSAVINAVMIQEVGGYLAGSPASGSVDHFGAVNSFVLPNSGIKVNHSTKWIALSGLLESALGYGVASLQPDVAVEQTLADYLAGRDTLVDRLTAQPGTYQPPDQGEDSLTRGYFLSLLYQAAQAVGADVTAPTSAFRDIIPFAYYTPAVNWAIDRNIALGDGAGTMGAARLVTRAEAAVLLSRFADELGLGTAEQSALYTDAASIPPWALEAARKAESLGLGGGAAFRPGDTLTRAQGEAAVAALTRAE